MLDDLRHAIRVHTLADEAQTVTALMAATQLHPHDRAAISAQGAQLVRDVRASSAPKVMEAFLAEYGLSTGEGIALMCLAEALLRVPDAATIDDLIEDKIVPHDWSAHLGDSSSTLVNASTWALMLTGRVLEEDHDGVAGALRGLVKRMGEPVIRTAVAGAMREMGAQFVLGRDIDEAMRRGAALVAKGYTYSYDMLGEAARTSADAARYHGAYAQAIASIGARAHSGSIRENPGISVKLSALHPRYEYPQARHVLPDLTARTAQLARLAADAGIGFNIDAEEADRLDLSLDVIEALMRDEKLSGWDGLGVVVQAYGQRAPHVIAWLHALAEQTNRRIMVRLVKGAYWDAEIKRAQVLGLEGFPVFTRKTHTDISYIACARQLLGMRERIYPQFATHNAHTAAAVLRMAGNDKDSFEFQRLHGMGDALHETLRATAGTACRIYAPVGAHRDLLAYLVRRLLENGANSSFVHQIVDEEVAPETIARDPFRLSDIATANPYIVRGPELYAPARRNAPGWDLTDPLGLAAVEEKRAPFCAPHQWQAATGPVSQSVTPIRNPAVHDDIVGQVNEASADRVASAVAGAVQAQPGWEALGCEQRALILELAADLYAAHTEEFFALATREAGKTLADGVAEVREAIDFLRYYAHMAQSGEHFALADPAMGEHAARGVIACISPWNFPLAIFTGQIAAALAAGNAVIAKPAEQTPLIAARAVSLLHEAGVPFDVLHVVQGRGETVGAALTAHPDIAGVCFTGSTQVARLIERQLAVSASADAMLIAETGGLNAMVVDSTALPEQAVRDIVASAFQSAGQRCSALRCLYVQRDVEDRVLEMLTGAMDTLRVGDPWDISTDVGPVIDAEAAEAIGGYLAEMEKKGRVVHQLPIPQTGFFVPPTLLRVGSIREIEREVFGPVLHVATYNAADLPRVIEDINASGYGLTFGLHTRIDSRVEQVIGAVKAGNIYVNRNQIGAIVGSQPFGGIGLSGTGPKAGGPLYLWRMRRTHKGTSQNISGSGSDPAGSSVQPFITAQDIDAGFASAAAGQPAASATRANGTTAKADATATRETGHALELHAASALAKGVLRAQCIATPRLLPGPTGELNQWLMTPRGRVLIVATPDNATDAIACCCEALAFGNAVVALVPAAWCAADAATAHDPEATAWRAWTAQLSEGARNALVAIACDAAGQPPASIGAAITGSGCDAVVMAAVMAAGGETARTIRAALAASDGPIRPLVIGPGQINAYVHEQAICVDTTAAGGNATLLAAGE